MAPRGSQRPVCDMLTSCDMLISLEDWRARVSDAGALGVVVSLCTLMVKASREGCPTFQKHHVNSMHVIHTPGIRSLITAFRIALMAAPCAPERGGQSD